MELEVFGKASSRGEIQVWVDEMTYLYYYGLTGVEGHCNFEAYQ